MTSMVRSLSLTARRRRGGPAVLPAGVFPAVLGAFWPAAVVAVCLALAAQPALAQRSEEHTSELQSLMRISYAVFCLKKKKTTTGKATNSKTQRVTISRKRAYIQTNQLK